MELFAPRAGCAAESKDAAALVTALASGESADRDKAESALRDMGAPALQALRDVKPEKEEAVTRVRGVLTDIALDAAKVTPTDAGMLHEIAREEGKGKRYGNAERLYRRAEQLYEKLKSDADDRKDGVKSREYKDKRDVCDRMKDKAGNKLKGRKHTGLNLGFVRVGAEHDLSDEWE
jgi:hypothetical protein